VRQERFRKKSAKILTSRWLLAQKTLCLARYRLVRDFASDAESFRSIIYVPTSSLDSLRCIGIVVIILDVSTAFMYVEEEEDTCLVRLPSNISCKEERIVCLLYKARNGLRRAPLLWFYQTVHSLRGEDTFEISLSRLNEGLF